MEKGMLSTGNVAEHSEHSHQQPAAHQHSQDAGHATQAEHAHVDHTGHEGMFRQRFWVCLVLSLPVLLYTPCFKSG